MLQESNWRVWCIWVKKLIKLSESLSAAERVVVKSLWLHQGVVFIACQLRRASHSALGGNTAQLSICSFGHVLKIHIKLNSQYSCCVLTSVPSLSFFICQRSVTPAMIQTSSSLMSTLLVPCILDVSSSTCLDLGSYSRHYSGLLWQCWKKSLQQ